MITGIIIGAFGMLALQAAICVAILLKSGAFDVHDDD